MCHGVGPRCLCLSFSLFYLYLSVFVCVTHNVYMLHFERGKPHRMKMEGFWPCVMITDSHVFVCLFLCLSFGLSLSLSWSLQHFERGKPGKMKMEGFWPCVMVSDPHSHPAGPPLPGILTSSSQPDILLS